MTESMEDSSSSPDDTLMEDEELNRLTTELDHFTPVIPPTVTEYYMRQSGLQTDDERVVKLLSASVQKFMTDIINDCFQLHKLREKSFHRPAQTTSAASTTTTTTTTATASAATTSTTTTTTIAAAATTTAATGTTAATTDVTANPSDPNAAKKPIVATHQTLSLNELTQVLGEYGINVKKSHYYT